MEKKISFDVFVSHSSRDFDVAQDICRYLESEGIQCWIAPRNVDGGKLYSEAIIDGIRGSQVFLLVFSEASNLSKHVLSELDIAFNSEKTIIPFMLDDTKLSEALSYYLSATHRISAMPSPVERYETLKSSIISNIPELAREREKANMYSLLAEECGLTIDELKSRFSGFNGANDDLQTQSENGEGSRSRYDIMVNDKGAVLMVMNSRKGAPVYPLLVIDDKTRYMLLYRHHESTVFFDDISRVANQAIRNCSEIVVCETKDDDVIREYEVPVHVVTDVRMMMDENSMFNDEVDLYEVIDPDSEGIVGSEDSSEVIKEGAEEDDRVYLSVELYAKDITDESILIYQQSGVCVVFPTPSYIVVPKRLKKNDVSRLAHHCELLLFTLDAQDEDPSEVEEYRETYPLMAEWMSNAHADPISVPIKYQKVDSVLQYLADRWNADKP